MMRNRFPTTAITSLFMILFLCGCGMNVSRIRSKEPHVIDRLKALNYALKSESWESVEPFFSEAYPGGYAHQKSRMENYWRSEDLVEIRFTVLSVIEEEDAITTQVRWFKSYMDPAGILYDKSGASEIVFQSADKQLKIIDISGEPFF